MNNERRRESSVGGLNGLKSFDNKSEARYTDERDREMSATMQEETVCALICDECTARQICPRGDVHKYRRLHIVHSANAAKNARKNPAEPFSSGGDSANETKPELISVAKKKK